MSHRIRHRGPDDDGIYLDGALGLCHRRLAILDPTPAGHQPMDSGPGSPCISYNGECYNYRELREDLRTKGHDFHSNTDTEVVLKGFADQGPQFLERLQGMFAFAFWDPARQALFLCRDRLGVKPLYYAVDGDRMVFASEIKPLLEAGIEAALDREALQAYLRLRYVPGERTLFRGIRRVKPGTFLRVSTQGEITEKAYWRLEDIEGRPSWTEDQASDALYTLLSKSVERRLLSDVPVGAFLSGGIDSSAIVALMGRHGSQPQAVTFAMNDDNDESATAALVAEKLEVEHRIVEGQPDDYKILEQAVFALEEPLGDAIIAPTWRLAQKAAEGMKVVLSGEGADEVLAGYVHHMVLHYAHTAARPLPARSLETVGRLLGAAPLPLWNRLFPYPGKLSEGGVQRFVDSFARMADPASAYCALVDLFTDAERRELFAEGFIGADEETTPLEAHLDSGDADTESKDFLNEVLGLDLRNWNANYTLLRLDKLTMAHSLEARVPFLDHELVEAMQSAPGRLKIRHLERKRLLRQALANKDLLPESVRTAPKRPFYLAFEKSFGPGFEGFVDGLLGEDALRRRGIFNPQFVSALRQSAGQDLLANKQLMALIVFELWARLYLDGRWRELDP